MEAIDYIKQMRKTLCNQKTIYPEGRKSDYEIILNYYAASGGRPDFEEIDMPVLVALDKAMPEITPENQRSISLQNTRLPDGQDDLEEEVVVGGKIRTRQQQYSMLSYLFLDFLLWEFIKADSKRIKKMRGWVEREFIRDYFRNGDIWARI